MLFNYGVTAFRAIKQQKNHFMLNVLGLGVGLASAILVALFALYELSYDKHQPNADRVFRLEQNFTSLNQKVPVSNYETVRKAIVGLPVEDTFALSSTFGNATQVTVDGESFALEGLRDTTSNILDWINIDVMQGDLTETLKAPNKLALNETEAKRLFGTSNAVGKTLLIKNQPWEVGAVFADINKNTHFHFSALRHLSNDPSTYGQNAIYSYIRLEPQAAILDVLPNFQKTYLGVEYSGDAFGDTVNLNFQPLTDIHLKFNSPYELKTNGSQTTVIICIGLSVLLLVLAAFNFINMSIAQSVKRAKEVGVRKALGAKKWQIAGQFLTEYLLITVFSLLIACVLVEMALPYFSAWVERPLALSYFSPMGMMILLSCLLIGLLSSAYPAWFMSVLSAKEVLQGEASQGKAAVKIRKALLIFQSSLSIALVIGAITLQLQLNYLSQLPVGYVKENRLEVSGIKNVNLFYNQNSALINRLKAVDGVNHVGILSTSLTSSLNSMLQVSVPNTEITDSVIQAVGVGFEAVENLGLNLVAGRDFSEHFSADWYHINEGKGSAGIILTESLLIQAGYDSAESAIGKIWNSKTRDRSNNWEKIPFDLTIVGVVKDVVVGSVKNNTPGFFFICGYTSSTFVNLSIKFDPLYELSIKSDIADLLKRSINNYYPVINVVSSQYDALYKDDAKASQVVTLFSGLAIFLAGMGIFGLASFSALRRQKEVAIRKVLGASRLGLINLLAKEYLVLVAISMFVAFPVSYWLFSDWLTAFNERIDHPWWAYGVAALMMLSITWLTVSTVAFRVASVRPGLVLRRD